MEPYYTWNVDPAWEAFSALGESSYLEAHAPHEFDRTRHRKAALLNSSITLEAFINSQMRKHLEAAGLAEAAIMKRLRAQSLPKKLRKWPAEIFGRPAAIADAALLDAIEDYHDLRNGIVHPKERDHALYSKLESVKLPQLTEGVALTIVAILEAGARQYPYWLLGWNFVGFNHDPAQPFLNNAAQFLHSLARMDYVPSQHAWVADESEAWQRRFLTGTASFRRLKSSLDAYPHDIEPWCELIPGLGSPPRLCRRWWDRAFILSTIPRKL